MSTATLPGSMTGAELEESGIEPAFLAAALADYGPDVLGEIAASILHEVEPALGRLAAAASAGCARDVEHEAHFIKGSVVNLGMDRMARRCQEIEDGARQNAFPSDQAIRALEHDWSAGRTAITRLVAADN